jgi:hypothetical protein
VQQLNYCWSSVLGPVHRCWPQRPVLQPRPERQRLLELAQPPELPQSPMPWQAAPLQLVLQVLVLLP